MKVQTNGISAATTVNEAIRQVPAAVAIFRRVGIDACCGGALPIGEAAQRHGVDAEQLIMEIAGLSEA